MILLRNLIHLEACIFLSEWNRVPLYYCWSASIIITSRHLAYGGYPICVGYVISSMPISLNGALTQIPLSNLEFAMSCNSSMYCLLVLALAVQGLSSPSTVWCSSFSQELERLVWLQQSSKCAATGHAWCRPLCSSNTSTCAHKLPFWSIRRWPAKMPLPVCFPCSCKIRILKSLILLQIQICSCINKQLRCQSVLGRRCSVT